MLFHAARTKELKLPGAFRRTNWRCCFISLHLYLRAQHRSNFNLSCASLSASADSVNWKYVLFRELRGDVPKWKRATLFWIFYTQSRALVVRVLFFRRRQIIYTHTHTAAPRRSYTREWKPDTCFPPSLALRAYISLTSIQISKSQLEEARVCMVLVCFTLRSSSKKDCEESGGCSSSHHRILLSARSLVVTQHGRFWRGLMAPQRHAPRDVSRKYSSSTQARAPSGKIIGSLKFWLRGVGKRPTRRLRSFVSRNLILAPPALGSKIYEPACDNEIWICSALCWVKVCSGSWARCKNVFLFANF